MGSKEKRNLLATGLLIDSDLKLMRVAKNVFELIFFGVIEMADH